MTESNCLKVKLSNSKINKLKSGIKNCTQVTLNLPSNVQGESNDEIDFLHKFLWTAAQVSMLCKAFENSSSDITKFSKT